MTQVKSIRGSFYTRVARAFYGTDEEPAKRARTARELTSNEKLIARRMARKPECTYADIHKALNWPQPLNTLRIKLKKLNIYAPGMTSWGNVRRFD